MYTYLIKRINNSKLFLSVLIMLMAVLMLNCTADKANGSDKKPAEQKTSKTAAESQNDRYVSAPDFALEDLDGNVVRLSDYKGKVVFLNFWATWCAPCRAEIPHFIDLVEQYGEDGFEIIGVAVDPRDFSKVQAYVDYQGVNYPILYDTKRVSGIYGGIQSIPTTFVINRDGKVVDQLVGSRPKNVFESIIKQWL
jgi:cytochrome c biogenesis protein CcmG/thiol:disulfide interchange protein DsbE